MVNSPPAQIGMRVEEVDTPALLVHLDAFDYNLDLMAKRVAAAGLQLRPHAKTHKCAEIALQQMARGAVGVCCQKVSEAEALVAGGVTDVLISNEIVDARKVERLVRLAKQARLGVCVDNLENVAALARSAAAGSVVLDVLVEVDVGGGRCGIPRDENVATFVAKVRSFPSLRFRGIHAYHGQAQHIRGQEDRRNAIRESAAKAKHVVETLDRAGIACEIVTGGGTGTYLFEQESGVYNELQPGSYIFMDADYARNDFGSEGSGFKQSLFVLTQVMSVPRPGMAVVDAGLKAVSVDSGLPLVADMAGVTYERASDDHGVLLATDQRAFQLGTKLMLTPGHCDPTVNLYDWFVGSRGGHVEALWPIARSTVS
ncbi:MAG TPA: DSD1 family PLP-dependent enzyme [Terriglobales bacterium]|nr:DSD1 family PLP-dependent enzyme [Terriglobales bacterium]